MRSQQINHRYSFPPLLPMNIVQSKPLLPEQNRFSTESPDDQLVDICTKYIPSSLFVPKDKLEPFESPLTESNLKFHTTIVSTVFTAIWLSRNCFRESTFSCLARQLSVLGCLYGWIKYEYELDHHMALKFTMTRWYHSVLQLQEVFAISC